MLKLLYLKYSPGDNIQPSDCVESTHILWPQKHVLKGSDILLSTPGTTRPGLRYTALQVPDLRCLSVQRVRPNAWLPLIQDSGLEQARTAISDTLMRTLQRLLVCSRSCGAGRLVGDVLMFARGARRKKSDDLHAVHIPPDPRLTSGRHLTSMPICQTSSCQTTPDTNMCFVQSTNGARICRLRLSSISAQYPQKFATTVECANEAERWLRHSVHD